MYVISSHPLQDFPLSETMAVSTKLYGMTIEIPGFEKLFFFKRKENRQTLRLSGLVIERKACPIYIGFLEMIFFLLFRRKRNTRRMVKRKNPILRKEINRNNVLAEESFFYFYFEQKTAFTKSNFLKVTSIEIEFCFRYKKNCERGESEYLKLI